MRVVYVPVNWVLGAVMIRVAFLIWLIGFSNFLFSQGLTWRVGIRSDGATVISSTTDGYNNLKEAIASVPENSWIVHLAVSNLLEQTNFQSEIFSYLEAKYPEKLEKALVSAGNMHNPAVRNLQDAFKEAVLNSSYIKEINTNFINRCERITKVEIEKFFIHIDSGKPKFSSFLWLSTEQCT
jgi:hypothetical protein